MSKVVRLFAFFTLLCGLSGFVLPQEKPPTPTEKRDAEKAWESLIKAKGGREKLYSITSMLADPYFGQTRLYVFPYSSWNFVVWRGPHVSVTDGTNLIGYFLNKDGIADQRKEKVDDLNESITYEVLPILLETKWYKPELLRVRREKNGKKQLDVIETKIANRQMDFVFEPEELLVSEVRIYHTADVMKKYGLPKEVAEILGFSDYTEINGIKMPQKYVDAFDNENNFHRLKNLEQIKILFNVNYDPEIFTNPKPATTADGWKRKP